MCLNRKIHGCLQESKYILFLFSHHRLQERKNQKANEGKMLRPPKMAQPCATTHHMTSYDWWKCFPICPTNTPPPVTTRRVASCTRRVVAQSCAIFVGPSTTPNKVEGSCYFVDLRDKRILVAQFMYLKQLKYGTSKLAWILKVSLL